MSKKKAPQSKQNGSKELSDRAKKYLASSSLQYANTSSRTSAPEELPHMAEEVKQSVRHSGQKARRHHGSKWPKKWFPPILLYSKCRDRFGYLTPFKVRKSSRLPFNLTTKNLMGKLGGLMGDLSRDTGGDSIIPAGFTYFGQFVDHDITFDVSSSLDRRTNANQVENMRTPALDLDNVYGRGPALDPHMYVSPTSGNPTAIKLLLGSNQNTGPGGPAGNSGMQIQTDFDVPRMPGTNTAAIGDPRNDENLIISQFQHAMLKFHNKVVDLLISPQVMFTGDVFAEAKKIVTHHYQWIVVHDFLKRICGDAAVNHALHHVKARIHSPFRMPVEFSVAAYRFGHSMIRNDYWVNFNFPNASLAQVFEFVRNPRIPVFSNWVVDFNAFVDTGIRVPVFNFARKIDSALAHGLEGLPGFSGLMAILATRNLRRSLAFGLPSGQATAKHFGITPMTAAQLTSGLQPDEVAVLNERGKLLLRKTPLWYYILREAAVLENGDQLGPVGAKIVADTFVKMLKRDPDSYLNAPQPFAPFLAPGGGNDFTLADLITFTGVHLPN